MVPSMIRICKISPQNTPAYFLQAVGQTLNAIINEASTIITSSTYAKTISKSEQKLIDKGKDIVVYQWIVIVSSVSHDCYGQEEDQPCEEYEE